MPTILIADDNEVNREMLGKRLAKKGFEVILAEDGVEACEKTRAGSPDLILMDMNMPRMTGWDATTALKADPATQAIPVIALTAASEQEDIDKAMAAGCDAYQSKPVKLAELLVKINSYLEPESGP